MKKIFTLILIKSFKSHENSGNQRVIKESLRRSGSLLAKNFPQERERLGRKRG